MSRPINQNTLRLTHISFLPVLNLELNIANLNGNFLWIYPCCLIMRMSLEFEKVLVGVSDTRCSQNCRQFLQFLFYTSLQSMIWILTKTSQALLYRLSFLAWFYAHIAGENASIQFFNLRSLSDNHIRIWNNFIFACAFLRGCMISLSLQMESPHSGKIC